MPKGGLLHVHLDATVDPSLLLRISLEHPAIHVRSLIPLTADNLNNPQYLPEFRPLPVSKYGKGLDIASPDYVPNTWVPLKAARQAFSLGVASFDQWVVGALTINPEEAYKTHNTVTKVGMRLLFRNINVNVPCKIWLKFKSVFLVSQVGSGRCAAGLYFSTCVGTYPIYSGLGTVHSRVFSGKRGRWYYVHRNPNQLSG